EMAEDAEFTLPELDGRPRRRKQTKKKVGKGRNDLRSYIGVIVRETISILLDHWRCVPLEMKETLWLHFQEKSKKAKNKRAKNVYNHRLGSTGYGGMLYRKKKESGVSEREIDRSEAWLMARPDRDGKYSSDVTPIAEKINELKSQVEQGTFQSQGSHDILGEALQKQPNGSMVQGVGQFFTPSMYFHVPDATELARERKMYQESFQFMSAQLERMNARLNAYNNTEVGSSNFPKPKTSTGVQIDNDQQSPETLGKRKADFPS
ncbi:hypothetical protein CUMW_264310, partial [Citrus unshiu]